MSSANETPSPQHPPGVPPPQVPFARRVVIVVAIAIGMLAVALFLWNALFVLLLAFAAILVGAVLRGMAAWLAVKVRLPVGGALVVVILALIGFFIVLGVLIAPQVVAQFERLADQLPQSVQSAQERLRQYEWGRKILGEGDAPSVAQVIPADPSGSPSTTRPADQPQPGKTVVSQAIDVTTQQGMLGNVARYARILVEALFTLLLVIIVGIYLAAQPRFYIEGTLKLFPKSERDRLRDVMHRVGRTLQLWVLGQLVPMAAIGLFIGGGLWLIGVGLWLPLGILAALLNFIPNFGPIIAAVPALLIALADSPSKAAWVIVLCVAAQNLEGYLITPLVQRRAVEMPPALTILSQVLLGILLGPLGVILAAPLTAAAIVVIKMLYVEDTLGTPVKTSGET